MAAVPVVAPALDVPVAGREGVLGGEPGAVVGEDRRPRGGYRVMPLVPLAVGRRAGALEHDVVGALPQGGVEVVVAPRGVERVDERRPLAVAQGAHEIGRHCWLASSNWNQRCWVASHCT